MLTNLNFQNVSAQRVVRVLLLVVGNLKLRHRNKVNFVKTVLETVNGVHPCSIKS
jgi:hypothetical protein